jgi:hypothetical protein
MESTKTENKQNQPSPLARPGADGQGVAPTSGGLEGPPKPIRARSTPKGSLGFALGFLRAFVKLAETIKTSQVPIKLKNTSSKEKQS